MKALSPFLLTAIFVLSGCSGISPYAPGSAKAKTKILNQSRFRSVAEEQLIKYGFREPVFVEEAGYVHYRTEAPLIAPVRFGCESNAGSSYVFASRALSDREIDFARICRDESSKIEVTIMKFRFGPSDWAALGTLFNAPSVREAEEIERILQFEIRDIN